MTVSATVPTVTPAIRPTEDEPSSVRGRTWKQNHKKIKTMKLKIKRETTSVNLPRDPQIN